MPTEKEPPAIHPLMTLDNFIATPHLGASTLEAQENVATAVAEQIVDYLIAGTVRNAVNVPSVPADQLPSLSPYINLAERMGLFVAQIIEKGESLTSICRQRLCWPRSTSSREMMSVSAIRDWIPATFRGKTRPLAA